MKPAEYIYYLIPILTMLVVSNVALAAAPVFGTNSESQFAREYSPPKGKAAIYIYQRKDGGRGISPVIKLNNFVIGRLVPGSFTVWKLSTGKVTIQVAGIKPVGYSFKMKPGAIYRFQLIVTQTSAGAKAELKYISSASALYDILGTRLLKNPKAVTNNQAKKPVIVVAPKPTPKVKPSTPEPKQTSTSTATAKPKLETEPEQTFSSDYEDGDSSTETIGLMIKTGTLSISSTTQFIVGQDRTFDGSASTPYGVDVYYQFSSGLTVGGELIQYTANFTTAGLNDTHDADVTLLMANVKQYFRTNASLQPFIGAGLGSVSTDVSGPAVTGSASGLAYQFMGGLEYRFDNIGLFGEIKYIDAVSKSDNNEEVDVSGTGIFAGVTFHF